MIEGCWNDILEYTKGGNAQGVVAWNEEKDENEGDSDENWMEHVRAFNKNHCVLKLDECVHKTCFINNIFYTLKRYFLTDIIVCVCLI